jgi:zinc transport system substrate-binding protein
MKRIADANVVIANGLGVEPFLHDVLQAYPSLRTITISDDCDLLPSNGHVWVSPKQAVKQVHTLAIKLGKIDTANANAYLANAEGYVTRLEKLSHRMKENAAGYQNRKIATLHDAFAYLARDLNLEIVATLEVEPGQSLSPRRMTSLVESIRTQGAAAIFYEPGGSERTAQMLAQESGVRAYSLNPFTFLNGEVRRDSYEAVMADNLKIISNALGTTP